MISSESATVVVRTGRAGRYADRTASPELLRGGLSEADRRSRLTHP